MKNSNSNSNSFLSIPIPIPFYLFLFKAEQNPTNIYHDYNNYKYQNNAINNFDRERNERVYLRVKVNKNR